jgi:acetyl esterase/lipase
MASWQCRFLKLYYRLQRLLHRPTGELDVSKERAKLEALAGKFESKIDVQHTPVTASGVPAEWLAPPNALAGYVILYLHGGGYTGGSVRSHRSLAANVARAARAKVLVVDYRLAPEHPFPAAVDDAVAAYRWLLTNNVAPHQIVVAGDSAGGGLALATLVALRDEDEPLPAAGVCLSPWTDLAATGESWHTKAKADLILDPGALLKGAQLYLGGVDPRTPLASPLYADLTELPPLLIQVATNEILLSDSTRLAEKARAAGVDVTLEIWPGLLHVWQFAGSAIPEAQRAIDRIGAFINASIEGPRSR